MELSPSSRLSFFTETGAIIQCPIEGRKFGIAIDIPRELWPSISLTLGPVSLPLRLGEAALCAHSEWPPCGPGHYELTLVCGEIYERRPIVVVPEYFTEGDFNAIIAELTDALPKSIASNLQACGGLLGTNLAQDREPSIEQEFFRLRRAIVGTKERLGILKVLPMIERDCYHVFKPRHELRKLNKARKPDISKLPQLISMPGNFFSSGALKQVFDVTVERSFETYENRLVKAYVQALQSQLSRLQARLEAEVAPPAIARELESLVAELRLTCARATFLREVRLPFVSAGRVTMVLLKSPAYRAVFEDYLALYKKSSVRLEEPALKTPLNNFPFLYQLWANLRVVSVMLQVCAELGYRCVSHPWVKRDAKGLFIQVMNDGDVAIELSCPTTGRVVSLVPWRTDAGNENPPSEGPAGDALSQSQQVPPALAIAIYTPEKPAVVLLFDPKYKVSDKAAATKKTNTKTGTAKGAQKEEVVETLSAIEPTKQDIDELLHCMDLVRTPEGIREIQYAAILYPGQRQQIASDLEALPARPMDGGALQNGVYEVLRRYLA